VILNLRKREHLIQIVVPSEARDLRYAAGCRSLASLGMTRLVDLRVTTDCPS